MRALFSGVAALILTLGLYFGNVALAGGKGTTQEAKAMAEKAADLLRKEGPESAYASFSKAGGPFLDRDLYVFVWDSTGKCVFNAGLPAIVGKTLIDLKDPDGVAFVRSFIEVKDAGWVEFKGSNPATQKIERKANYIVAVGDLRVGVGAFLD
jgi:cytochrome c